MLRIFQIRPGQAFQELTSLPAAPPADGFLWLAVARADLERRRHALQDDLQRTAGRTLLDLHLADLENHQQPSHYDCTADYDILVFRRLADAMLDDLPARPATGTRPQQEPQLLPASDIQTEPVGFAIFERVLLSVHPDSACSTLGVAIERLSLQAQSETGPHATHSGGGRLPTSAAELMLRMLGLMVDDFLVLRKAMTTRLDHWQQHLLRPNARFGNWEGLLQARQTLHHLESLCEDQLSAVSGWIETLEDLPPSSDTSRRTHEILLVRSRDVAEHIGRVARHVRLLEQSAETAVQIHFTIQGNRTNDVMRTLTAITAIFLPLGLIADLFGMGLEFLPWLRHEHGFWWTLAVMCLISIALVVYFSHKRYLSASDAPPPRLRDRPVPSLSHPTKGVPHGRNHAPHEQSVPATRTGRQ